MAKNKADENQLDLFSMAPVEVKAEAIAPVKETVMNDGGIKDTYPTEMIDGGISTSFPTAIFDKKPTEKEVLAEIEQLKAPETVQSSIQTFLKDKEDSVAAAEVKAFVEIAGQVKMDAISFSQSIPDENRFVSLSLHSDMVIITPIPEDGSLNLKAMKENYPTFVTQVQKVTEDSIPDPIANLEFLDKLRTIVEGKLKAGIQFDKKEVDKEMAFIGNIDQGDVDFDEPSVEADEPAVEKPKAKGLKM